MTLSLFITDKLVGVCVCVCVCVLLSECQVDTTRCVEPFVWRGNEWTLRAATGQKMPCLGRSVYQ